MRERGDEISSVAEIDENCVAIRGTPAGVRDAHIQRPTAARSARLGSVDTYRIHRMMAARVTTAR